MRNKINGVKLKELCSLSENKDITDIIFHSIITYPEQIDLSHYDNNSVTAYIEKTNDTTSVFKGKIGKLDSINKKILHIQSEGVINGISYPKELFKDMEMLVYVDFNDSLCFKKMKSFEGMFKNCSNLKGINFNRMDCSLIKTYDNMFLNCTHLETIDMEKLECSPVSCNHMFKNCYSLNSIKINDWDVRNLKDAKGMFSYCEKIEHINLDNWELMNVKNLSEMFYSCGGLSTFPLNNSFLGKCMDLSSICEYCESLISVDLSSSGLKDFLLMKSSFSYCSSLKKVNLKNIQHARIIDMQSLFQGCYTLTCLEHDFTFIGTKNTSYMFSNCFALSNFEFNSGTSLDSLEHCDSMFENCSSLTYLDFLDTKSDNILGCSHMFTGCSKLKEVVLSNFSSSFEITLSNLFADCHSLKNVNMSAFKGIKISNASSMFCNCLSLVKLDVSELNFTHCKSFYALFYNCKKLRILNFPKKQKVLSRTAGASIFYGCDNLHSLDLSMFTVIEWCWFLNSCNNLKLIYVAHEYQVKDFKKENIPNTLVVLK